MPHFHCTIHYQTVGGKSTKQGTRRLVLYIWLTLFTEEILHRCTENVSNILWSSIQTMGVYTLIQKLGGCKQGSCLFTFPDVHVSKMREQITRFSYKSLSLLIGLPISFVIALVCMVPKIQESYSGHLLSMEKLKI